MAQPVVVGVDGSAESPTAAEWAAREAVRRDRPLRLLHAWNWLSDEQAEGPAPEALIKAAEQARLTAQGRTVGNDQSLPGKRSFCVVAFDTLRFGTASSAAVTCDEALRPRHGTQPAAMTVARVTAAGRAWAKRMRRLAVAAP
ncbi:universal stress protein [Streptomyces sp. T12]|uniref:universal stress protein n=1 Tax=Streptomyces sp. T12 TaxID=477697 RepID=UPI0035A2BC71